MCFGGGQQSTNNVTTPAYKPEEAHTAVTKSQRPEATKADEGAGMKATTLAPTSVPTVNPGLNLKGM